MSEKTVDARDAAVCWHKDNRIAAAYRWARHKSCLQQTNKPYFQFINTLAMSQPHPIRRTDRRSRLIKATPAMIYNALIDPKALATWRAPNGMKGRIDHFEAKEGGTYSMTLTYEDTSDAVKGKTNGKEDRFEGRFIQLVPNEKIVEETEFDSEDPAFAGTMRITTALSETGDGTEVTMTCENVPPGIREEDHLQGIASSLDNLAAYTER